MTIRSLQRLGRQVFLGGGPLAGLLLSWISTGTLSAQTTVTQHGTLSAQTTVTQIGPQPVAVQSAGAVQRSYLNKKVFQLPIQINDALRTSIQEIQLYSKDHLVAPWVLCEKAGPAQTVFTFQAPADGEYWFTMVTVDKQGRCHPNDLRNEPPGLSVVIDTEPPAVVLTNLGTTSEGQMIQVDMTDLNLDSGRVHYTYQAGENEFRPLMRVRGNVFCIPAQVVCTGVIQVSAEDLAGNQTVRQEQLSRMNVPKTEPSNRPPIGINSMSLQIPDLETPGNPTPKELPRNVISGTLPIGSSEPHQGQRIIAYAPERPGLPRPNGSECPRWIEANSSEPAKAGSEKACDTIVDRGLVQGSKNTPNAMTGPTLPSVPATTKNAPQKRQLLSKTRIALDYQIENAPPTSVAKIEVWLTRDQCQTWQKYSEAHGPKSPIELQLPGDGVYGLTLVVSNCTRAPVPPIAGDQPDIWIEVDTTKPLLQINAIQTTYEKGKAVVQICWIAQDKNLAETPVDLFYAATPQGPWLPIAKGLPGDGQYRWTPPTGLGPQTHLQVIARDAVGNTSVCGTREPVSIAEPARPRAVIRTISTGGPQFVPQQ